jgi:hypothetical protein
MEFSICFKQINNNNNNNNNIFFLAWEMLNLDSRDSDLSLKNRWLFIIKQGWGAEGGG